VALVSVAAEFTTQVSSSADDAKAFGSNMEVGSSDALVGNTGYYICDFLARFTNVGVPQGAQVDSAFVVLRTSSSQAGTVCSAAIVAEDTSSSSQFVSYADYASRHLGDSVVEWYDLPAVSLGDWIRTPDVGTVVGEIVNRGDWLNGNALAIFIRDNGSSSGAIRRFSQFDGNSAYACSLLVYYSVEANSTEIGPRRRRVL
jgi:hypothetical protein